jgi:hypothetical protein
MERDPTMGRSHLDGRPGIHGERTLALGLDGFAWEALERESVELGVSIEELVAFSVLYYLADRDSQRIARRIPPSARPLIRDRRIGRPSEWPSMLSEG